MYRSVVPTSDPEALDTNVLARYVVDDPENPDAAGQRPAAIADRRLVRHCRRATLTPSIELPGS